MIKKVEISNIMSIDKCELSFDKAKYKYLDQFVLNNKVANPIAIYGRNGSGKTSFLLALSFVTGLLTSEINSLGALISNFSLKENRTSYVEITFEIDDEEYIYHIETSIYEITKEFLLYKGFQILSREKKKYIFNKEENVIESPYYPALRNVANLNLGKTINKAYSFLSNIAYIYGNKSKYSINSFNKINSKDIMVEKSKEVKEILKQYKSFPIYDMNSKLDKNTNSKIYYASIQKNDGNNFEIPYEWLSGGMINQSFMLSALLSLPENGVLVIDELEDALHPLTILNYINEVIKRNVQLIFVSQNTNILSQLRPDNVVFANWNDGVSTYKRLSDIYPNIREVNNIEKMYLSSTFDEEIEK